MKKLLLAALTLLLMTGAAYAEDKSAIVLKSTAEVELIVKAKDGTTTKVRVDAAKEKIVPGMEVIFSTSWKNTGKSKADNAAITNPVPNDTTYVSGSAEGKGTQITFSVDGGKTYNLPAKLMLPGKDGKMRPASASEYTHIRWEFAKPLDGGAEGSVSFRASIK